MKHAAAIAIVAALAACGGPAGPNGETVGAKCTTPSSDSYRAHPVCADAHTALYCVPTAVASGAQPDGNGQGTWQAFPCPGPKGCDASEPGICDLRGATAGQACPYQTTLCDPAGSGYLVCESKKGLTWGGDVACQGGCVDTAYDWGWQASCR